VFDSLEDRPVLSSIPVVKPHGKRESKRLLLKKNLISQCNAVNEKTQRRQPAKFTMFRCDDESNNNFENSNTNRMLLASFTGDIAQSQLSQPPSPDFTFAEDTHNSAYDDDDDDAFYFDHEENRSTTLFSSTYGPNESEDALGAHFYAPTLDKIRDR
jgi:hypothetical protein